MNVFFSILEKFVVITLVVFLLLFALLDQFLLSFSGKPCFSFLIIAFIICMISWLSSLGIQNALELSGKGRIISKLP